MPFADNDTFLAHSIHHLLNNISFNLPHQLKNSQNNGSKTGQRSADVENPADEILANPQPQRTNGN